MTFLDALDRVYAAAPCQVLPNPLWKSRRAFEGECFACSVEMEGSDVTRLTARDGATAHVFWTRDRAERVPAEMLDGVRLALLHADYGGAALLSEFTHSEQYFRLIHRGAAIPVPALPPGFRLVPVLLPSASRAVADLIGRCYLDLRPSAVTVEGWMQHPVFSPDLWLWIMDDAGGRPAALGIAELDARIGEGALEWVQVLPEYRGQGLGTALVSELLRRLADRATFVTVSGQVDNVSNPEGLYRRCGFQGQDLWWVLRR